MTRLKQVAVEPGTGYAEESSILAIIITLVVIALVGIPLGLYNKRIGDEGSRSADVSNYSALAIQVNGTVRVVRQLLKKGVVDEVLLAETKVTLITPGVVPTNLDEVASDNAGKLNVKLSAIYWSSHDPLVTIDNENYRVGDKVKGFTITEIRKTEVVFRSPFGEKTVMYFYEYLDSTKTGKQ